MARRPVPGQEKTLSVTTDPVIRTPAMIAKNVKGAIDALRRQCFQTTFHSARPLIRVSFTNSVSSTSSIEERTSRMMAATWNQPSVMAGRIMYWIPPRPEVGSQPRCTAKIHISTIPSQNPGSDCPSRAMTFAPLSHTVPFLTADRTPMGSAIKALTSSAKPASWSVAGRRSITSPIAEYPGDEDAILDVEGLVEPPVLRQPIVVLLRGLHRQHDVERVTAQPGQSEYDQAHDPYGQETLQYPSRDVSLHCALAGTGTVYVGCRVPQTVP